MTRPRVRNEIARLMAASPPGGLVAQQWDLNKHLWSEVCELAVSEVTSPSQEFLLQVTEFEAQVRGVFVVERAPCGELTDQEAKILARLYVLEVQSYQDHVPEEESTRRGARSGRQRRTHE